MSEREVDLLVARLRDELAAPAAGPEGAADGGGFDWPARTEAERLWPVTADLPFLFRVGAVGRARGLALVPVKKLLRKLMRWYVEPPLGQQRDFNAAVLRAFDQLSERIDAAVADVAAELADVHGHSREVDAALAGLKRSAGETEERLLRVERRSRRGGGDSPASAPAPRVAETVDAPDYFAFEARMRGSRELVRDRQAPYVDDFRDSGRVLDIGCGRGEFLQLLRDAGVDARGIDLDEDMVDQCRADGLDVERADAIDYLGRLDDASLGGIFAAHVLEHLPAPRLVRLLELAAKKLRGGGVFIAETPNPLSLTALANFSADLSHEKPLHPATLEFLARQAGFRETELRFLSEPPPSERLRTVPLPPGDAFDAAREALDADVARLNDVVFGAQDYAVVART